MSRALPTATHFAALFGGDGDARHAQPRIAAKHLAQSRDAVLRSAG